MKRILRAKLEKLNPGLPASAYDDAIRQLVEVSAAQTMAAVNREKDRVTVEKTFEVMDCFATGKTPPAKLLGEPI